MLGASSPRPRRPGELGRGGLLGGAVEGHRRDLIGVAALGVDADRGGDQAPRPRRVDRAGRRGVEHDGDVQRLDAARRGLAVLDDGVDRVVLGRGGLLRSSTGRPRRSRRCPSGRRGRRRRRRRCRRRAGVRLGALLEDERRDRSRFVVYVVVSVTDLSKSRSAVTWTVELPGPEDPVEHRLDPAASSAPGSPRPAGRGADAEAPSVPSSAESTWPLRVGDRHLVGVEPVDAGGDEVDDRLDLLGVERRCRAVCRRARTRWPGPARRRRPAWPAGRGGRRRSRRRRSPRWCWRARPPSPA